MTNQKRPGVRARHREPQSRLNIMIPLALHEAVDAEADKRGISSAEWVRQAIEMRMRGELR